MSCELADRDGAYVLGSLSPAERKEFEQHLAGCKECARNVRELAGLPGLLARVDRAVLEDPDVVEPVPDTLLPALVREVRRADRRHTLVTAGLAAAAAVVVGGVPLAVSGALEGDRTSSAAPSPGPVAAASPVAQRMAPVGDVPVRASLAFASVTWGTRLDLTCTYAPSGEVHYHHLPRRVTYALVVRTRDGRTEQVGTWRSLEGRTMRLTAGTSSPRDQIASVQVRTTEGRPVLELTG
jgi:anti-sigma factor RsiW